MKKKLYFGSNLKMYKNIQDTVKYLQDLVSLTKDISREEMAVMLVRALGYGTLAQSLSGLELPFDDVTDNRGYVAIAYDIGMITGVVPDMTVVQTRSVDNDGWGIQSLYAFCFGEGSNDFLKLF